METKELLNKTIFTPKEVLMFCIVFFALAIVCQIIMFLVYGLLYECYCATECMNLHYQKCLGVDNYSDTFLQDKEEMRQFMEFPDRRINESEIEILEKSSLEYEQPYIKKISL